MFSTILATVLYFAMGFAAGSALSYIKNKMHIPVDEYYFLRDENKKCQVCFLKRQPFSCSLKTCSYKLLLKLVQLLNSATESILICSPSLTLQELSNALIAANRRNVKIRMITEAIDGAAPTQMQCMVSGIPVRGYGVPPDIMMHNKFMVIDDKVLVRGSLNWTLSSLQGNYENLQFIRKPKSIEWYRGYFDEMWAMRR